MRATVDGNEAAASVAYRCSEVCCIYPDHALLADGRAGRRVVEPRAAERVGHGPGGGGDAERGAAPRARCTARCRAGRSATTFTASQGLLLMIPNMYKIAGELTAAVMHVAARSLAAQGLSIFGDHSDVMAVRQTGFRAAVVGVGAGGPRPGAGGARRDARDSGAVRALLRRLSHLARAEHDRAARRRGPAGAGLRGAGPRAPRPRRCPPSGRSSAAPRRTPTSTSRRARRSTRSTPASRRWCRTRWTGSASAPAATTGWSTTAATPRPSGCSW